MHTKFSTMNIYDNSTVTYKGSSYFIGRLEQVGQKWLGVSGNSQGFTDTVKEGTVVYCPSQRKMRLKCVLACPG